MSISSKPDFYFDMQQFSEMKLLAKTDQDQSIKAVSKQFEALFVQKMLKSMRAAATIEGTEKSNSMDFYTDMYDKQLSVVMADAGGLGIAKMMTQQLLGQSAIDPLLENATNKNLPTSHARTEAATSSITKQADLPIYQTREYTTAADNKNQLPFSSAYISQNPAVIAKPVVTTDLAETNLIEPDLIEPDLVESEIQAMQTAQIPNSPSYQTSNPAVQTHQISTALDSEAGFGQLQFEPIKTHQGWDRSENFITDILPHAAKAAKQLGISPGLLVAQSALETGWGKHAMKRADGSLSFNLFGIKANHNWAGESVKLPTLEFRDGLMQQEQAQFRSYESLGEGFDDYVDFIRSNPRYSDALQHQGEDAAYIRGLQKAGYATDPNYANKVLDIMSRDEFSQSLAALQSSRSTVA